MRASPPPSRHRAHHCNVHASPRQISTHGSLAQSHQNRTSASPPSPLTQADADLKRRRLQRGRDASGAVVAHPNWAGFSPREPCIAEEGTPQRCPQRGKRRSGSPSPLPLTRVSVKAFARRNPDLQHTRPKTAAHPHHLRNSLARNKPGEAKNATMMPQASTKAGDTSADLPTPPPR
jgi:hypothetical protein